MSEIKSIDFATLISECTAYDFKVELEEKKPKSWLKSVSAFANGDGGSLFFGVNDCGVICGLNDVQKTTEKISDAIKERMDPMPEIVAVPREDNGLKFLEIKVPSGKYTPYYYVGDGQRIAFIRVGNESVPATDEQMVRLVLKGSNRTWDSLLTDLRVEDNSFSILANTFKQRVQQPWDKKYLKSFGLVTEDGCLTNAGALFSDDCPLMQSRLYCTRWDGVEKDNAVNDAEYTGNLLLLLRSAQEFAKSNTRKGWEKLPNGKKIKAEYAERAVLEALVNHFIHRDYSVLGSEVHLDIYDDRMVISSPGGMYNGSLIQEQDFREVPSERRNPILADVMAQLDYMEKRGSGLKKIYNETRALDGYDESLRPLFKSTTSNFATTIFRLKDNGDDGRVDGGDVTKDVLKDVLKELSERQRVILAMIASDVRITIENLSGKMSVNERTIRRDLSDLQEKGLLKRVGGRKDGHWVVNI